MGKQKPGSETLISLNWSYNCLSLPRTGNGDPSRDFSHSTEIKGCTSFAQQFSQGNWRSRGLISLEGKETWPWCIDRAIARSIHQYMVWDFPVMTSLSVNKWYRMLHKNVYLVNNNICNSFNTPEDNSLLMLCPFSVILKWRAEVKSSLVKKIISILSG